MKATIIYASVHHENTKKVVEAIAGENVVDLIDATKEKERDLSGYDLIGFASGVILIFQIILFVISIRKKTKKLWRILFSAELVPLLISIGLMIYYNDLPGYGFMPGLTYLGEILFSLGAVVLYCISFLISICSYIAISNKQT